MAMFEFDVQRCTRRCAKTDRELKPGETIYSALISKGSQITRVDYAAEAWDAEPEDSIGWWKAQVPEPNAKKMNWAPNDVMLDFFTRIEDDAGRQDTRFVLALLLLRRRVLRQENTDSDSAEVMVLHCPRDDSEHRVRVAYPPRDRVEQIQAELAELLMGNE